MQDGQAQTLTDSKSSGPSHLVMSFSQANTKQVIDANIIITEIPFFPSHWTGETQRGFWT